jgi:hypothetical protein
MHLTRSLCLLCSALCFHAYTAVGQHLELADLFYLHSLDSIALKKHCTSIRFPLGSIDEDAWTLDYIFEFADDKKISLSRVFPKPGMGVQLLRYTFYAEQEYKKFWKAIHEKEFLYTGSDTILVNLDSMRLVIKTFDNSSSALKIELGEQQSLQPSYFVTVYSKKTEPE